jgi:hypothetical protein
MKKMKKIIHLVVLLGFYSGYGQTNVYHPFPDSNAVWRMYASYGCPANYVPQAVQNYQYTMGGDTTIGQHIYKKINKSGMFSYCPTYTQSTYYNYGYIGALRQDSANKKVYFKCPAYPDTLIYDFSKQVGDTVNLAVCSGGHPVSYSLAIQAIDSVLVGNKYHKQFHFYNNSNYTVVDSIIEGVGATSGLLESIYGAPQVTKSLVCFSHNADIYPSNSASCPLITGVSEFTSDNRQITVYPNPNTGQFKIETGSSEKQNLQIFDINGKLVLNKNISGNTNIDVSNLTEGIYTINITGSKDVINKKLVIQNNK